jgi:pantoate--beta-alanine ligase
MERLTAPEEMRAWSRRVRGSGERLAFVPTMGALHEGHLSLVRLGRQRADRVAVSVFVNPTQFGPGEDFERYPRDPQGDAARLESAGADAVWFPETADLYPAGASTWVTETDLSVTLEGATRPGHFRGVTTVVTKLLEVVEPDLLVLGQKDAQQVAVLRRMVRDPAATPTCPPPSAARRSAYTRRCRGPGGPGGKGSAVLRPSWDSCAGGSSGNRTRGSIIWLPWTGKPSGRRPKSTLRYSC